MITSIYRNDIKKDELENMGEKEWSKVITSAVAFATHVCMSYENYISQEFAEMAKRGENF
jgi:fructokinase